MDGELGSLEEGKLADLVELEKNPLEDLRNSTSIRYTMVGGRLYEAETLDEVGNSPRKREPLFFEREGQEAWGPTTTVGAHED